MREAALHALPTAAPDSVAAARRVAALAAGRADAQDRDDGFPAEDVADLARAGLLAAPVPAAEGGAGLGQEPGAADLAAVLRLVGLGSLALGRLYEGHVNALQLVARYAAPADRHACSRMPARATCSGSGTPSRRRTASSSGRMGA